MRKMATFRWQRDANMIASKTASLRQARTFGRLVMASAIGVGGLPGEAAPVDESMARYRWKYRRLVVFAPSGTDTRLGTQQSIVAGHRNGLRERATSWSSR